MKIKWFGMGSFLLISGNGKKIIMDPYDPSTGYSIPEEAPDIVTVSHNHFDHSAVGTLKGEPYLLSREGDYSREGINFRGVKTFHDNCSGSLRGENIAYSVEIDNIFFVHLGDIGHILSSSQLEALMPCDILALPVGGVFTVGAEKAAKIASLFSPSYIIPMHYSTPSCTLSLKSETEFINLFSEVERQREWEGGRGDLPKQGRVLVLRAAGEL